jgi:hypothetical protein
MALLRRLKGYPGHPSHPPLTDVSIGAYTIAVALLVLGALGLQEPTMAHGALLAISAGLLLAPPTMLTGLLFVPATLVAMSRVAEEESGVAASLRNTSQQVGGSIGLAVLGTVAWTVVANSIQATTAHATAAAQAGHPPRLSQAALTAIHHHALATGFSRAFLAAAGAMLLALVITIIAIRMQPADPGEAQLSTAGPPDQAALPQQRNP